MKTIKKSLLKQDDINKIIYLYTKENKPFRYLAKMFKKDYNTIRNILIDNNIHIRKNNESNKLYSCDYNFFDIIDTEKKAYWLGFMYADGYVFKNKNAIGITLSQNDILHLEKFKNDINATYNIKTYIDKRTDTMYSKIILTNKHLYKQAINKGLLIQKTNILTFPDRNILPLELIRHFIRGYIDGDGCITRSLSRSRLKMEYKIKICGTKEILYGIHTNIPTDKNFKLYKRHKNNTNNYSTEYGGSHKLKCILDFLYKDSNIYLDRKYNLYKDFINDYFQRYSCL